VVSLGDLCEGFVVGGENGDRPFAFQGVNQASGLYCGARVSKVAGSTAVSRVSIGFLYAMVTGVHRCCRPEGWR